MSLRESALDHPLPAGMRDFLPPETRARRRLAEAFLRRAELVGYNEVTLPAIEYASTMERGLGTLDPRELVRFVEPDSGQVVALRADVTPQIARLVSTRLSGRPTPYRLAYHATVVRRRAGSRARTHRQIPQLGLERIDELPAPSDADLEPLQLALDVLAELGLSSCTVDLGHAEVARRLIAPLPLGQRDEVIEALGHKDRAALVHALDGAPPEVREVLQLLPTLHGAASDVFEAIPDELSSGPAAPSIAALRNLAERLGRVAPGGVAVRVDLGEVHGLAYYTGPFAQILADGPGVPIASGGRYDDLLARFGRPLAATGMALDVDALLWALRTAERGHAPTPPRVVVAGPTLTDLASTLRARGMAAVTCEGVEAHNYGRAWDFTHVLTAEGGVLALRELATNRVVHARNADEVLALLNQRSPVSAPVEEHG